ncbi:hypothetical protein [Serratia microhaemolytica]|uniref:hypothetical protein n=1 Tax=Serratia microhaemolytica TaxID=2675110 RepID=UPI000FDF36F6|nr:hypothetical protein [Serratia microhaemolytica]
MAEADWVLWGSLSSLLPSLAEAAPNEFLTAVENVIRQDNNPFGTLFAQERAEITGRNYLTGLLWALEGLAWDEQYLIRVCVILGELASHDPGARSLNRPSNSLATILLPWMPQTLASIDKRKSAMQTLLKEWPDIAWQLMIQLLPDQWQISRGSHKPAWRRTIPANWQEEVTPQEYEQQVSYYAERAVALAGQNIERLCTLINHLNTLPASAFAQLLQHLASQEISASPEEQRVSIWEHLTKFTKKHRKFSTATWALSEEKIKKIEQVTEQLSPANPFFRYQLFFTNRDIDLYEENGNWQEQREKIEIAREKAILEIFQQAGVERVIQFAEIVKAPHQVGYALGVIADTLLEKTLLPHFLESEISNHKLLVSGFICRKHQLNSWKWCDNLDKSAWTPKQIAQFLACLPFTQETWDRASEWLQTYEGEYWLCANVDAYQIESNITIAIDKLIKYGRPHAAIDCLATMQSQRKPVDSSQCIRALLAAITSSESNHRGGYYIVELIKFLQAEPSVNQDELLKVEWAYLPLLDHSNGRAPKLLVSVR